MKTYLINSLTEWDKISSALWGKGYIAWQFQYSWNMPEVFHSWFWKEGRQVEIVTFN